MLKALYEAIRNDAAPVVTTIDDRSYTDKALSPVKVPTPEAIRVSTLTGMVDYLKTNVDELRLDRMICHVVAPSMVYLHSKLLAPFENRACFMKAILDQLKLPVNEWMGAEAFNIALQACFVDGPTATDLSRVLAYSSNVTATSELGQSDDGISQAVTIKTGIASKAMTVLPNPVTLRPYRTFTEVEQPESKFVFRCRQADGGMQFMLAEADGGAWRGEAMKNIKAYMEESVPGLNVIA